jgi:uncharacterized protein (DUF1697 family)
MKTQRWICLFRGINVGGHNILPMAKLVQCLQAIEFTNVRTYIQSGNVVFDSTLKKPSSIEGKIIEQVEKQFGFYPQVVLMSINQLRQAIDDNPFAGSIDDPKSIHFFFLKEKPKQPSLDTLEKFKAKTESFALVENVFYLHAPDGIGRSKLASSVEKRLGVAVTARNLRTIQKLLDLARGV